MTDKKPPSLHPAGPRHTDRAPTHPGTLLRDDVLPTLKMPVLVAAERLGISRQTLHRILSGTLPVTPQMALRLGKFCGNGPTLWLDMQQAYDLWHAQREISEELARIKTANAAA